MREWLSARSAALLAAAALSLVPQAGHAGQASHAAGGGRDSGAAIRAAEAARSEIADTVHYLADVYGPRLTASPAAREAALWAAGRLRSWGLKAHLEPWAFGHPGWRNARAEGQLLVQGGHPLSFGVAAWTPGTGGPLTADAVLIDPPQDTTATALDAYLSSVRGRVQGRIVLIGRSRIAAPEVFPPTLDADVLAMIRGGRAVPSSSDPIVVDILTRRQRSERIDAFLVGAKAAMRVDDAARPYGVIGARANMTFDVAKAVPSVVLRNEDYGRVVRLLDDNRSVGMRFDIENVSNADGRVAYNVVADIPGTDKADELVILGAHLDSWHIATGAADNAIGCAIMMEVGRLIRGLSLHPRRTIRIVLWSGEEQYLLGSQAYVAEHFGTAERPGPEFGRLAAYVNVDGGSGRIRGANIFGPQEAAAMLQAMLRSVADLGVEGAIPHGTRRLGSTDATTFSRAGLTSIGLIQDPLDYSTAWHGDLDTFERVDENQARQAATVAAVLALTLSDSETMPPKFSVEAMPVPIGPAPALARPAR